MKRQQPWLLLRFAERSLVDPLYGLHGLSMAATFAFFTDRSSLPGLHVALYTLGLHHSDARSHVHIFYDGLSENDVRLLEATHRLAGSAARLICRRFKARHFGRAKSLHGNYVCYGRLYLANLLGDYPKCIYLDCDLIINDSLLPLYDYLSPAMILAADGTSSRRWSPDRSILQKAGLDEAGMAFNSGVLAINLSAWREQNILSQLTQAANIYGDQIKGDQPLLNIVLAESWKAFGTHYNYKLFPSAAVPTGCSLPSAAVYHLVGSPKPWDPFGKLLNSAYAHWYGLYLQTAIGGHPLCRYWSLRRFVMLAGRYRAELIRLLRSCSPLSSLSHL